MDTFDLRFLAVLALPVTLACGDADVSEDELTASQSRVTYYDDVLPILTARCETCHSDDGIGPFSMSEYEETKTWGAAMAKAARGRVMPPYAMDASGECNEFVNAQWLEEEEIATLEAWVEGGMEMGDEAAPRVPLPEPNRLLDTGAIVAVTGAVDYSPVPEAYPGGELEDYQCFLADYDASTERFLTGFDVLPGNLATVHHVLVMEVDPRFSGNGARMRALDEASPDQEGWSCFGAAGDGVVPEGVPVAWAPGAGAVNYPAGTGIRIEAGNALVIQVHYDLSTDDGTDTTRVQLAMADSVEREGRQTLSDPFLFSSITSATPDSLPAGQAAAAYTWEMSIGDALYESSSPEGGGKVDVYGLLPHMHKRGTSLDIEFDVDGQTQCGGTLGRWDFNWQRVYLYQEPITMAYDDVMRVTCTYDTSTESAPVLPGFGTDDEMCLVGLYVVPR